MTCKELDNQHLASKNSLIPAAEGGIPGSPSCSTPKAEGLSGTCSGRQDVWEGHGAASGRVRAGISKQFFTVRAGRHGNRLPSEVGNAPCLSVEGNALHTAL